MWCPTCECLCKDALKEVLSWSLAFALSALASALLTRAETANVHQPSSVIFFLVVLFWFGGIPPSSPIEIVLVCLCPSCAQAGTQTDDAKDVVTGPAHDVHGCNHWNVKI